MSMTVTYNCSVCGKAKGAGNKWIMGRLGYTMKNSAEFFPWSEEFEQSEDILHLCGEACMITAATKAVRSEKT